MLRQKISHTTCNDESSLFMFNLRKKFSTRSPAETSLAMRKGINLGNDKKGDSKAHQARMVEALRARKGPTRRLVVAYAVTKICVRVSAGFSHRPRGSLCGTRSRTN